MLTAFIFYVLVIAIGMILADLGNLGIRLIFVSLARRRYEKQVADYQANLLQQPQVFDSLVAPNPDPRSYN